MAVGRIYGGDGLPERRVSSSESATRLTGRHFQFQLPNFTVTFPPSDRRASTCLLFSLHQWVGKVGRYKGRFVFLRGGEVGLLRAVQGTGREFRSVELTRGGAGRSGRGRKPAVTVPIFAFMYKRFRSLARKTNIHGAMISLALLSGKSRKNC